MRLTFIALITALLSLPVFAQEAIGPSEFEARTTGRTLIYTMNGQDVGIEEYLEGRRVRWHFMDGDCFEGDWYSRGEMICFAYEGISEEQCWTFFDAGRGIGATFGPLDSSGNMYSTRESHEPILCLGPKVGA